MCLELALQAASGTGHSEAAFGVPLSCGLGLFTDRPAVSLPRLDIHSDLHPQDALVPEFCSLAGADLAPTWMLCWVRMLCPRPVCISLPSAPTPAAACGPLGPPSAPKPSSCACSAASAEACARARRKFQKDRRLGQCVPAGQPGADCRALACTCPGRLPLCQHQHGYT